MAVPNTRETLKQYCLRRLGKPVIKIEVDDDQLEDRIDEALQYYQEYHFDSTERVYLKHTITQDDIDNTYIAIPSTVNSISRVFTQQDSNVNSMFSVNYQMRLNNLADFSSTSVLHYDIVQRHISLLDSMLRQEPGIQFSRHMDKLFIEGADWSVDFTAGTSVCVIECYRILDPDTYVQVWNDIFLKEYVTALFKYQWGSNLSKFENVILIGGVSMNGTQIQNDAKEEIEKLQETMSLKWETQPHFLVG
jgi:hypothetical protein